MNRDEALDLLRGHIENENLIKHSLAAESLMQGLARRLWEKIDDEEERIEEFNAKTLEEAEKKWGMAGLLHDLDWEQTKDNPNRHSLMTYQILQETDVDPDVAYAIKVHNPAHGFEPDTLLAQALYSAEEITGLVTAAALVQPDKKLQSVSPESVMKKFKSKSFASGVDREVIKKVQPWLEISVEELVEICIEEMKKISDELGL